MITWKKVGENIPTNKNKFYPNSPETPFVSCVVWVCHPEKINGGILDTVRWNTRDKCWHKPDFLKTFIHEPPYQITHFCDEINVPRDINSSGFFCEHDGCSEIATHAVLIKAGSYCDNHYS